MTHKNFVSWLLWIIGTSTGSHQSGRVFVSSLSRNNSPRHSLRTFANTKPMPSQLEIEEKFQLSDSQDLETKLKELGFAPTSETKFVDWYFDSEPIHLTLQDCWLRYRELAGQQGNWELKRGRGQNTSSTVYEEILGHEAISIATSMIPDPLKTASNQQRKDEFDGFDIPTFDGNTFLYPFCRIETRRSSWQVYPNKVENTFSGLTVDLDATDTGHSVGEVEIVVEEESQVESARGRVQELVAELTKGEARDGLAIGKLEHYLISKRPEHYKACVEIGVIKDKIRDGD